MRAPNAHTPGYGGHNCETWNAEAFKADIREECYFPPLSLEDGKEDTFLETSFRITRANTIRYWLKNDNEPGEEPKTWRYAHFSLSYAPFTQKKGVLMACPKKVHGMASDQAALTRSATQKIAEFARLQYPRKLSCGQRVRRRWASTRVTPPGSRRGIK